MRLIIGAIMILTVVYIMAKKDRCYFDGGSWENMGCVAKGEPSN